MADRRNLMMEKRKDYEIAAENFAVLTQSLGLDVTAQFVPQSQSRRAAEKSLSLNWRCTVTKVGEPIKGLESVDYMQGIGHAPSYKSPPKLANGLIDKWAQAACAKVESESGMAARISQIMGGKAAPNRLRPLAIAADDVLQAICRDADVLDYADFETWADDLGFDPDSQSGETTYRLCLSQALALRAAIGDENLTKLCAFARDC
jgi:hypothetical protein